MPENDDQEEAESKEEEESEEEEEDWIIRSVSKKNEKKARKQQAQLPVNNHTVPEKEKASKKTGVQSAQKATEKPIKAKRQRTK